MLDHIKRSTITKMLDISSFVKSDPEPRDLIKVIAIKMLHTGYTAWQIENILDVPSELIEEWYKDYLMSELYESESPSLRCFAGVNGIAH
jgi:alkyl sulfatase BDS1-like metallo-beta-lactamase superfamily hydrolase